MKIVKGEAQLCVGTEVEWTVVSKQGRCQIKFEQRHGKVHSINGDNITIKSRNGRLVNRKRDMLHITGNGHNPLTKAVLEGLGYQS